MTWAAIFERGESHEVTLEAIRQALAERRNP
jgi:hypothetical protein